MNRSGRRLRVLTTIDLDALLTDPRPLVKETRT